MRASKHSLSSACRDRWQTVLIVIKLAIMVIFDIDDFKNADSFQSCSRQLEEIIIERNSILLSNP